MGVSPGSVLLISMINMTRLIRVFCAQGIFSAQKQGGKSRFSVHTFHQEEIT